MTTIFRFGLLFACCFVGGCSESSRNDRSSVKGLPPFDLNRTVDFSDPAAEPKRDMKAGAKRIADVSKSWREACLRKVSETVDLGEPFLVVDLRGGANLWYYMIVVSQTKVVMVKYLQTNVSEAISEVLSISADSAGEIKKEVALLAGYRGWEDNGAIAGCDRFYCFFSLLEKGGWRTFVLIGDARIPPSANYAASMRLVDRLEKMFPPAAWQ